MKVICAFLAHMRAFLRVNPLSVTDQDLRGPSCGPYEGVPLLLIPLWRICGLYEGHAFILNSYINSCGPYEGVPLLLIPLLRICGLYEGHAFILNSYMNFHAARMKVSFLYYSAVCTIILTDLWPALCFPPIVAKILA